MRCVQVEETTDLLIYCFKPGSLLRQRTFTAGVVGSTQLQTVRLVPVTRLVGAEERGRRLAVWEAVKEGEVPVGTPSVSSCPRA